MNEVCDGLVGRRGWKGGNIEKRRWIVEWLTGNSKLNVTSTTQSDSISNLNNQINEHVSTTSIKYSRNSSYSKYFKNLTKQLALTHCSLNISNKESRQYSLYCRYMATDEASSNHQSRKKITFQKNLGATKLQKIDLYQVFKWRDFK